MKKCGQCKKSLDEILFILNDKDHKICNKCREYASSYYKKDREKYPEKYLKIINKYKENNKEKIKKRDRVSHKKYREENPEKYKEWRLGYLNKNKDKMKAFDDYRMLNRPEYFLFSSARARARKRGLEFNITEQDIKKVIDTTLICPLRKVPFERGTYHKAVDNSMSLDRIDSSKGYIKNNIQLISYRANIIKNNITLDTFRIIVNKLPTIFQDYHFNDDKTREIIINDRLNQIKNENRKNDRYRILNLEKWLFTSARKRARKNKLEFSIDTDYIKAIWPLDNRCPILGQKFVVGNKAVSDYSASIDRIDNNKGYIKTNIMILCAKVNAVKNNASQIELEFMLKNWEELDFGRKEKQYVRA